MNAVEKARAEVLRREAALKKLMEEKESLSQIIMALERKKAAAERALALGDETQRKAIRKIEHEIDQSRLKGLEALISEAEAALSDAREALKEAERLQGEQLGESIRQDEEKRRERFTKSLPGRLQKIADLYLECCNEIGEVLIEGSWVDDGGIHLSVEAEGFLRLLPGAIGKETEARGYRRQNHAPWNDAIIVFPFSSPDVEGFVPGANFLEAGAVSLNRHRKRAAELKGEMESSR